MAIFITQGQYTADAIRGLLAKPEDRTEEVGKLIAAAGGRLQAFYYTLGEYDFVVIAEAPSERDIVAALLAAAGSGTITNFKTTTVISAADMKQAFAKAGSLAEKFRAAGE